MRSKYQVIRGHQDYTRKLEDTPVFQNAWTILLIILIGYLIVEWLTLLT